MVPLVTGPVGRDAFGALHERNRGVGPFHPLPHQINISIKTHFAEWVSLTAKCEDGKFVQTGPALRGKVLLE